MFELNDELKIEKELFLGSIIYTIDNFYKNPLEVHDYLFSDPAPLWKINERPTRNGLYFEDRRLSKEDERLIPVVNYLSDLVLQSPRNYKVVTNQTKFVKDKFNDIKNCHWWPHLDTGYNGIVYFNDDTLNGTNLYKEKKKKKYVNEHYEPWREKNDFDVIKYIQPKYNRLVLFEGDKFLHGMDISDYRYFLDEYRKNQVFFFENV